MLLEVKNLTMPCLEKLARKEIMALHVKEFIPPQVAAELTEKILKQGYNYYTNAPSIGRIGMAFYETEGNVSRLASYFDNAAYHRSDLRDRCAPLSSPIDLLRCTLDETWPAGAMLESLYGRKMYVGLSRVVDPDVTFLAHHDIFTKDAVDSFWAQSLLAQLACNVYLSMPKTGGGLKIWDQEMEPAAFDAMRQSSYGIDPNALGEAHLHIEPEPGDLVLFNSHLMHAVMPGPEVPRLSLSCFVGYRGPAAPLTFWS